MKTLVLAATLLAGLAAPAFSQTASPAEPELQLENDRPWWKICDNFSAGPGATIRLSEGRSGGMATAGCLIREKYEIRAFYFGEQKIYGDTLTIDAYAGVAASRVWLFRSGKRVRPLLQAGLMLKEAQRCHFDGDLDCNRITPLPFCFLAVAGVKLGDVLVTLNHCSNDSLDWGPEKKNLGQDFLRAEVWW